MDVPWLRYRSTWTVYLLTEIVCPGTRVPLFCCAYGWGNPCGCAMAMVVAVQPWSSWLLAVITALLYWQTPKFRLAHVGDT